MGGNGGGNGVGGNGGNGGDVGGNDQSSFPHSCDNLFQWIEARPANSTEQWNNVKQWNPSPPGVKYHFELLENIIKV